MILTDVSGMSVQITLTSPRYKHATYIHLRALVGGVIHVHNQRSIRSVPSIIQQSAVTQHAVPCCGAPSALRCFH